MKKSTLLIGLIAILILCIYSCKKTEILSKESEIKNITIAINGINFPYTTIGDTIQIFLPAGTKLTSSKITAVELSEGATCSPKEGEKLVFSSGMATINVLAQDGTTNKKYIVKVGNIPFNSTIISAITLKINNTDFDAVFSNDTAKITVPYDGILSDVIIKTILLGENATCDPAINGMVPITNFLGTITVTAQDGKTKKSYWVKIIPIFSSSYLYCSVENLTIFNKLEVLPQYGVQLSLKYSLNSTIQFYRTNYTYGICKAQIKEFSLNDGSVSILTSLIWIDGLTCKVMSTNVLKSNTQYKALVKITYLEKQGDQWVPLLNDRGIELTEQKEIQFTTGTLDGNLIPEQFISYTYPINRQFNFYKNEYNKGYYMFAYDAFQIQQIKSIANLMVRYIKCPSKDTIATINTSYESQSKTLWYNTPNNLLNGGIYKIELLSENKVIHEIYFRCSKYNSYKEKLPDNMIVNMLYDVTIPNTTRGGVYLQATHSTQTADEFFDNFEIYGKNGHPLLRRSLVLSECPWYQESVYKYIYDNYNSINDLKLIRDTSETGIPVTEPIKIWQIGYDRTLADAEINSGLVSFNVDFCQFENTVPYYWKYDYISIYSALHKKYTSDAQITDDQLKFIYNNSSYYSIKKGAYPILVEYVLPGINIVTSSKKVLVNNSFDNIY